MLQWGAASVRIEDNKPKPPPGDWEGEAADAAYARMTTFGNWLTQLSEAWHDLAEAASKIIAAHDKAKSAHDPIAKEYIELEARMQELAQVLTERLPPAASVLRGRSRRSASEWRSCRRSPTRCARSTRAVRRSRRSARRTHRSNRPTASSATGSGGGGGGGAATNPPVIRRRWPRRWASQWEARSRNSRMVHSRAAAPGAGHHRAVDHPRAAALGGGSRAGRPAARLRRIRRSYPPIRACGRQRVAAADRAAGPAAAAEGRRLCRPQ